jgi:Flp pilus assembly protein TadD
MLVIAATVTMTFWPALSARAVAFDDSEYLLENPLVLHPSWDNVRRFFTEVLEPSSVHGYYQPLTMTSLMLNVALGGSPTNLRPFHRTSLALHVTNTMLVIALLFVLLRDTWSAVLAGVLFGLHPIATESIPWLSERKTLLATCFSLASLALYGLYAQRGGAGRYGGSMAFYVLSLLSKPTTTMLPLAMILLDWWPLRRRRLIEKLPFVAIAGVSSVITVVSQGRSGSVAFLETELLTQKVLIICHNLVLYLRNVLWPAGFPCFYPAPEEISLASAAFRNGVVGTSLLLIGLLLSLRWTRAPLAGWLIFLVLIFPTLGVIRFMDAIAANKYVYLPMIGLLIPLAALIRLFLTRPQAGSVPRTATRMLIMVVILGVAVAEAFASWQALSYWSDGVRLYTHYAAATPQSARLQHIIARAYVAEGNPTQAIRAYERAIELDPEYAEAHDNLAVTLVGQGRFAEATVHFREAMRLKPDSPMIRNNCGVVLSYQSRWEEAETQFREAVRLDPGLASARFNLGRALARRGRHADAIEEFAVSLQVKPDDAEVRMALGQSLEAVGDIRRAAQQYETALRITPDHPDARRRLAALRELLLHGRE